MWKIEQQRRVVRNMSNIKHFGNFPTVCITVLSKDASDTVAFLSESIHNTTNKNMIHVTELVWSWLLYLWYSFTCRAACYQHVSGLACIYCTITEKLLLYPIKKFAVSWLSYVVVTDLQ